jgi:hypothetical protein
MSILLNDHSNEAPKLKLYLNLDNLCDLRPDSIFPANLSGADRDKRLSMDGFEGVQLTDNNPPLSGTFLPFCGLDRINLPQEAEAIFEKHAQRGDQCLTVHVGWGLEDDTEIFRLVEATLNASTRHRLPVFFETHRATITQDVWRTVQIIKHFPEIRFNADFSHYYCGLEMVYGDWSTKLQFMEPLFSRVGFIHGRIASPGCMQVPIADDLNARPPQAHGGANYLEHFRELWTLAMKGFLGQAGPGDVLVFAPELLKPSIYYARVFPNSQNVLTEESDRYAQALLYQKLAQSCFATAKQSLVHTS